MGIRHNRTFGLVGHPVSHSLSPLIFKNLSELTGEAVAYFGVDLEPWQVDRFMELSRRWGWAGYSSLSEGRRWLWGEPTWAFG